MNKIVINSENHQENDYLYCWEQFKSRPNKISLYSRYYTTIWETINSNFTLNILNDIHETSEVYMDEGDMLYNTKYFIKLNEFLYASFIQFGSDYITELTFYYSSISKEKLYNFIEDIYDDLILDSVEENTELQVNTVMYNPQVNNFELFPINLKDTSENIEVFYTKKTFKECKEVISSVNANEKGLSIIHSERGRGKTNFLSYLVKKSKKQILWIPSNLIDYTINNNDFINFLLQNKNSILIIDDIEWFVSRFNRGTTVSNLIQLVDGLLSETLGINIILSINLERNDIDENLLNCNNLHNVVYVEKLDQLSIKKLNKKLNIELNDYQTSENLITVLCGKRNSNKNGKIEI
jgi:hypothetical protein